MAKNKQRCEKVSWDYLKRECKYDKDDNNLGLHFGLHIYEHKNDYVDIVEVEWVETEEDRNTYIKDNKLEVIDDLK